MPQLAFTYDALNRFSVVFAWERRRDMLEGESIPITFPLNQGHFAWSW